MGDERDRMLRDMATHRGFKLVKWRRRRPGGDFGRYGLTDANTGQDCFGIGRSGLEASADEIEDYLRGAAKADWKRSLGGAGKAAKRAEAPRRGKAATEPPARRKAAAPKPEPEPGPAPDPPPGPAPEPDLVIRDAKPADGEAIAALLGGGDAKALLRRLVRSGEPPLVAEEKEIVGCAAYHLIPSLQHGAVGRITLLLVADHARRRGIGTRLMRAAEGRLAERGCSAIEAMSDIDLASAHGFFRRLGYERTSYRYARAQTNN